MPKKDIHTEETMIQTELAHEDTKQTYRAKKLSPNTIVTVKNGYNGKLVYKSRRTGEKFVWEAYGDEQDMELQTLKDARNSYKVFFINNWFIIPDPEVIAYLGVERYYKHALDDNGFDELFKKSADAICGIVGEMTPAQKRSLVYRAKQSIDSGKLDSIKVITALEKSLGVELIDR